MSFPDGPGTTPEGATHGQFPYSTQTILRRPQVESLTGLRRATIYQRIQDGLLPRPVKMGVRVSGWPAREITAVNEAVIAGWSDDQIRQLVADLVAQRTQEGQGQREHQQQH